MKNNKEKYVFWFTESFTIVFKKLRELLQLHERLWKTVKFITHVSMKPEPFFGACHVTRDEGASQGLHWP